MGQKDSPFGAVRDPAAEAVRELLIRLWVIDRVCKIAIDAGMDRIESIQATPDIQIRDGTERGYPVTNPKLFFNRLPVGFKLRGPSAAIFKVVHGIQQKGEFLAVTGFSATKDDDHADLFVCELEVSALLINGAGDLQEKKEAQP
jgi:hypothetical protein